ncbi:unnamed protein product, partial [Closterium sp. NIES-54]
FDALLCSLDPRFPCERRLHAQLTSQQDSIRSSLLSGARALARQLAAAAAFSSSPSSSVPTAAAAAAANGAAGGAGGRDDVIGASGNLRRSTRVRAMSSPATRTMSPAASSTSAAPAEKAGTGRNGSVGGGSLSPLKKPSRLSMEQQQILFPPQLRYVNTMATNW